MPFVQIAPTDNAYISQFFPNKNFGKLTTLLTGKYLQSNDAYRSLLKFNLADTLSPGNVILSAFLELFVCRKDKSDVHLPQQIVKVYTNSSDFSQNAVTWNNAPELTPTHYSINVADGNVNNFISIDITSIVISWFYNIIPNNGITLVGIDNIVDTIIGYKSSEWTISEQRPFLNIEYGTTGLAALPNTRVISHPMIDASINKPSEVTKPIKPSTSAYGYIYNVTEQTVDDGADIIFNNNGVLIEGITHTESTTSISISAAGNYIIQFSTTSTTSSQFAIVINGTTVAPGSVYGISLSTSETAQQNQGQVIITVSKEGSIITLRNVSGSPVSLATNNGGASTNSNASIVIVKLI